MYRALFTYNRNRPRAYNARYLNVEFVRAWWGRIRCLQGRVSLCPCGVYYKRTERRSTRLYTRIIFDDTSLHARLPAHGGRIAHLCYAYVIIVHGHTRPFDFTQRLPDEFHSRCDAVRHAYNANHRVCGGSPHLRDDGR